MASTMGISMVLATVIGLVVGRWLDGVFETSPWLTFVFLLIGLVAGFRNIYIVGKKAAQNDDES